MLKSSIFEDYDMISKTNDKVKQESIRLQNKIDNINKKPINTNNLFKEVKRSVELNKLNTVKKSIDINEISRNVTRYFESKDKISKTESKSKINFSQSIKQTNKISKNYLSISSKNVEKIKKLKKKRLK